MGVRGAEPPEGWNFFKKFVKIGNGKLKNLITFQKYHDFLREFWQKTIRIIENSIRPGGSGGGTPRS